MKREDANIPLHPPPRKIKWFSSEVMRFYYISEPRDKITIASIRGGSRLLEKGVHLPTRTSFLYFQKGVGPPWVPDPLLSINMSFVQLLVINF